MITASKTNPLQDALLHAQLHDPFSYLGSHREHSRALVRVFRPYDANVWIRTTTGFEPMRRIHPYGVFEWRGESPPDMPYRLRIEEKSTQHTVYETYDPYAFPLQISDHDLYLFNEGKLTQAYRMLGAQRVRNTGIDGMRFSVWAPNAERVSIVGDFNRWDGRNHRMSHSGW